jgi:hypothetical protein
MENKTRQIIVNHHGPKGIGNKMMSNHLRHPQLFHKECGSLPHVFVGVSIAFPV